MLKRLFKEIAHGNLFRCANSSKFVWFSSVLLIWTTHMYVCIFKYTHIFFFLIFHAFCWTNNIFSDSQYLFDQWTIIYIYTKNNLCASRLSISNYYYYCFSFICLPLIFFNFLELRIYFPQEHTLTTRGRMSTAKVLRLKFVS